MISTTSKKVLWFLFRFLQGNQEEKIKAHNSSE